MAADEQNLFADIYAQDAPTPATPEPEQPEAPDFTGNLFADIYKPSPEEQTDVAGAFIRGAERNVAPAVGGFAGAGMGAQIGLQVGTPFGPWGMAGGTVIGALAGFFAGSTALSTAQEFALDALPDDWVDVLGQDDEQRQIDEKYQSTASYLGGLVPYAIAMKPGLPPSVATSLPANATAFQRLMANPVTSRVFSGSILGGVSGLQEFGMQALSGEPPDWTKIAIATGFGIVFNQNNRIGAKLTEIGAAPTRRLLGQPDPVEALRPQAVPEAAPEPTIAQASDAKVMGPGVTEEVFMGTHQQAPEAQMVAQEQARMEATLLRPSEAVGDLRATARSMEPELFGEYDMLVQNRRDLADAIESGTAAPDGLVAKTIADIDRRIQELAPDVAAAHRRAADAAQIETVEPEGPPAPPTAAEPEPGVSRETPTIAEGLPPSVENQVAEIAQHVAEQITAAGRSPEEASLAGQLLGAHYRARASRFKTGAMPIDLYRTEGPVIRGFPRRAPLLPTLEKPSIAPEPVARPPSPHEHTFTVALETGSAEVIVRTDPRTGEITLIEAPGNKVGLRPQSITPDDPRRKMTPEEALRFQFRSAEIVSHAPKTPEIAPSVTENTGIAPAAAQITPETAPAEPAPAAAKPRTSELESLDPSTVGVDAERFQFKAGGDAQGVTERLQGVEQWDPRLAGTVLVWRDEAGKDWIADGHQRLGLATRLKADQPDIRINAFVLDAASGVSDAQARAIAAVKNIVEGTGTPIDAAKVMKAAEDLGIALPPMPPRSTLVRDGRALAQLSPEAFGMVINEVVPAGQGAIVGRLVKNPADQAEAVRLLAASKPETQTQAEMVIRDMLESGTEMMRQESLFGEEAFASSVVLERAKIAEDAIKQLRRDKTTFRTLVDQATSIEGQGENVLDQEANRSRLATDEQAAEFLTQLAFRAGPVSDALSDLARKLKAKEISTAEAGRSFLGIVRDRVEQGLEHGPDAGGAESGAGGERDAELFQQGLGPQYPLAPRSEWYGEANYEDAGGVLTEMSPDEFLARARPLEVDESSRENIDDLKQHIQSGKTLDPLKFFEGGKEDGRHRAIAAKELGITKVPVIEFGDQIGKTPSTELFQSAPPLDTPEFNRFFGASKVVDAEGNPLPLYHGTKGESFEQFDPARIGQTTDGGFYGRGFSLTPDRKLAQRYAGKKGAVLDLYVRMEKPFIFDHVNLKDTLARARAIDPAFEMTAREAPEGWTDALKAQGYDGVIVKFAKGPSEYLAFDPDQIIFDAPDASRILYQAALNTTPWREGDLLGEFETERGVEGLPQTLIPGVKPMTEAERIAAEAAKPMTGGAAPAAKGSLFDVEGREDAAAQAELFQKKRGSITLEAGKRPIIKLFADADASTFLHESGHQWLEELLRDAAHPDIVDLVKADAGTVKNWLGMKPDQPSPTTKQHEKFARGFEQYMREGVAPSAGLARVFAQFKSWLSSIYQSIKGLGAPINDDIRAVFDRLIEVEPNRAVVAPEFEAGPTIQTVHETEAAEVHPAEADAMSDRIIAERDAYIAQQPEEIRNELAAARAAILPPSPEQAGTGDAGSGSVEPAGVRPDPLAPSGAGGGERSAQFGGGGEGAPAGGGAAGGSGANTQLRGERSGASGAAGPLAPGPNDIFGAELSPFIDKAGNIRVDNLTSEADVSQAIHDSADANSDFIGDRRGVITDGQVLDLADALGMDVEQLNRRQLGQAFNAEQVVAARKLLVQSATNVAALMKKAATGSDADVMAYAQAKATHQMIQGQVAGITAEAGRALRAFRNIAGSEAAMGADQFIKQATGKTLFQLRAEAKMGAQLDSPAKVSKFVRDSEKLSFGDMMVEYWINALVSGPRTHVTNMVSNTIFAIQKMGPETLTAAAIGAVRSAAGRKGERIRFGEVAAQFRATGRALPVALKAAMDAAKAGKGVELPSEGQMDLPLQPHAEMAEAPKLDETATYAQLTPELFGMMRGLLDSIVAVGKLVATGGDRQAPLVGLARSNLGAIPDIQVRGTTVLPIGSVVRVPTRMLAAADSFFRALSYSAEKGASSYRTALDEGLTGSARDARIAQLYQNPTEAIMARSSEIATELTFMSRKSEFVKAFSKFANTPIIGVPIVRFISPFINTPANIIEQTALHRTVLGLFSPEIRADLMGKNGNLAQDTAMAKMLVGSAYAIGFGFLAARGLLAGNGPTDSNERALWRLEGNQPNSVRVGDIWYDIRTAGPVGLLASISADLYDVAQIAGEEGFAAAAAKVQSAFMQNILNASFMTGPADLIQALEDPDRYGQAYVDKFLSSLIPAAMAQPARAMDPYLRDARTTVDAIKARVPFLSQSLPARLDIWGNPMPQGRSLGLNGLSAVYMSEMTKDPVNLALAEIGYWPGRPDQKIRGVDLTDDQYDQYVQLAGRMAHQRLKVIVTSGQWRTWPQQVKHDVMAESIRQSRETARGMMLARYPAIVVEATKSKLSGIR